jgi:hypothetical protein
MSEHQATGLLRLGIHDVEFLSLKRTPKLSSEVVPERRREKLRKLSVEKMEC